MYLDNGDVIILVGVDTYHMYRDLEGLVVEVSDSEDDWEEGFNISPGHNWWRDTDNWVCGRAVRLV